MASNLYIHMLGDFNLADDDGPVTAINSPRMQSLLAYLLLHRAAPQPRYHVAFLLWPDSLESQARSNLRNLLHRLRHAYPGIEAFIEEDNRDLCWRAGAPYTFDVAEFEAAAASAAALAKRAQNPADSQNPQDSEHAQALLAALEPAVELYAGDLLPGCYDEWILPDRERLRQEFLEILEKLSILQEKQGQYRQAINSAQHLLRYDPLLEATYRRLMQLHALTGDRTGALRVYQTCKTVLKRELDVEPDTATRKLYESLLVAQPQPSADTRPSALGGGLTSFIGREREIASVRELLKSSRLVTLTGVVGSGKTRLGQEAAGRLLAERAFADGVCWVELAAVSGSALVPQAVAAALRVRERPGETLRQTLIHHLHDRALLLLLDNCEHLIGACAGLAADLLRACPGLRILATGREALGVLGEVSWTVPPLAFPTDGQGSAKNEASEPEQMLRYESVRLFVERAALVLPTFQLTRQNAAAVAQICRRVEGLPLAIELAAARVKMMSAEQIAARLDNALPLLKASWSGELAHHQTLQAAIDWSYNLLSGKEQALLRRLSVFSGGFTLEAAEQVTPLGNAGTEGGFSAEDVLDLLSSLIDKSLVALDERGQDSEVRYRLLEVIRQYAWKMLAEAAELEQALCRHAGYFCGVAEDAGLSLRGSDQEGWLHRLDGEYANLRAVLEWSISPSAQDGGETGLRLAAGLWQYWDVRGSFTEGRQWLQEVLSKAPGRTIARARALKAAGALAWGQVDFNSARAFLSESLEIFEERGEKHDIAAGLLNLGILNYTQGDYAAAGPLFERSLGIFRGLGHRHGIANVLSSLGVCASDQGEYDRARAHFEECLALRREIGDKRGIAVVLGNLGLAAWRQGDSLGARPLLQESLERYRELGDRRGAGTALNELSQVAQELGELDTAYALLQESLAIWQELGNKEGIAIFLEGSAGLACRWSDYERAASLLAAAEMLREWTGSRMAPADRGYHARILGKVKAALPASSLTALWAGGRTMSVEAAIALAARTQPVPGRAG